jgi:hypothetical protein
MTKIGNSLNYDQTLCDRCGSKRKETKKWTEKIKTENSLSIIEHSQIICTNKNCQAEFEKHLIIETQKREAMRLVREENSKKNARNRRKIPDKTPPTENKLL